MNSVLAFLCLSLAHTPSRGCVGMKYFNWFWWALAVFYQVLFYQKADLPFSFLLALSLFPYALIQIAEALTNYCHSFALNNIMTEFPLLRTNWVVAQSHFGGSAHDDLCC